MALFGGKAKAEAAKLRDQLAQAQNATSELREQLAQEQGAASELWEQLGEAWDDASALRRRLEELRGPEALSLEAELRDLTAAVERSRAEQAALVAKGEQATAELRRAQAELVETREIALLQQVGIYEYAHPLEDALAYKNQLAELKRRIKDLARGNAVTCHVNWTVDGSAEEGQRLGRGMAKLMLRAYNAEADNAVRGVKAHTREAVKDKLTATRESIGRLGTSMRVSVSAEYHRLRLLEIDLTADHLAKVEAERERARAERERLREEAKVLKEIEREQAKLTKERAHYAAVVAKLEQLGDETGLEQAREQLAGVDEAIAGVRDRAANVRLGHVYVISNIGAFGPDVVKIGMTRRLDPMDRVRELGDASVPFRFDVHALCFSKDAVALKKRLHHALADRRVNAVNHRREFFYATPEQVRALLAGFGDDHVLEYTTTAEAVEWRASDPARWLSRGRGHRQRRRRRPVRRRRAVTASRPPPRGPGPPYPSDAAKLPSNPSASADRLPGSAWYTASCCPGALFTVSASYVSSSAPTSGWLKRLRSVDLRLTSCLAHSRRNAALLSDSSPTRSTSSASCRPLASAVARRPATVFSAIFSQSG
ncbi:UPF0325 protein YaeH [Actinosynnema pretiosum subsp. pretiosum]|nr:UPF0325 protein YaeH [Actinosynnema pretiosum subsp. pretiosum]